MARINIPRSEYEVLRQIADLPQDSFSEFVNALRSAEPKDLDLSGQLSKKITRIKPTDLKSFSRTIFALYRLREANERTPEDLARDVQEAIERDKPQGFSAEFVSRLVARLSEILSIGGCVAMTAKATDVIGEQERIFCGARILSDMRPVFPDSPGSISAAVITHMLKISFHKSGDHRDFYVMLTPGELKTLKKVIERAEKKSESLKLFIEKSGVKLLGEGD